MKSRQRVMVALTTMKIRHLMVAKRLDMSESGVSLLRNGHRFPLMSTMERIEDAYGWPVEDQVRCREGYADEFNRVLQEWYSENGITA